MEALGGRQAERIIDLGPVKREARRVLEAGHPLRTVIEAQPDLVSGPVGWTRLEMLLVMALAFRAWDHPEGGRSRVRAAL